MAIQSWALRCWSAAGLAGLGLGFVFWERVIYYAGGPGHHSGDLNTAIERLCDFVQPKQDARIKAIKDLAAGAVLCASLAALIVGGMIVIRHLIR